MFRACAIILAIVPAVASAPVLSAEAGALRIELNKLEASGEDCLVTVVTENVEPTRLDTLKLDFVVFDQNGIVAKRMAAELGPLAASKTVVKTFPMAGVNCSSVKRLLVNDVLACEGDGRPVSGCVGRIETSSRASVQLVK